VPPECDRGGNFAFDTAASAAGGSIESGGCPRTEVFLRAHKRAGNDVSADGNVDEFPDLEVSIQRKWQFAAAKEGHCMLSDESGVSRRAGGKKGQHTTRATKQRTDAAPDGRG